jgi:hypothetical protein
MTAAGGGPPPPAFARLLRAIDMRAISSSKLGRPLGGLHEDA